MGRANRAWSEAERDAVLGAAAGGLKMAIALGMFAGMRIGDAVRVTWSIYDGTNLEWRQGKTGDAVWLPAHRELRALLDAAPRTATTIVTGAAGRPLMASGLAKAFRTLILRLEGDGGIGDGLTFRGLRHTAGKTLADLGADPRAILALLGQRSLSMAIHYSQEADRRRAATAAIHFLEQPRNEKMENRRAVFQNEPREDD
jgi:integrase